MATSKKTQIVITANAAVAKKVMDELAQRTDAIKQKMAALDVTTAKGRREFNKLKKELVSYNSAISQNITNEERVKHAIDNLSTTSLSKLRTALASAKKVLGTTFQDDPNLKKKQQDVRTLQAQIDKLTGSVHKQRSAWQTAAKNLTAYVGLFQAFGMVKNLITGVIKKNFEYSGSLTDIRKVSGLTEDQVKSLSRELAKIDTRTSVDALAQLAYQGAKLGVGKYGVDGMAQFVRAADKINVAIGEEMGEEALPALLKMTEVMGLIPKMGLERSIEATGSAMFKLASTSTATSNDIVEFARRCTGVARTAGITTDQLLALGSAFSAQMASPEVAATAMSKFIVALQKNHNLIEKDLSIPAGTISKMYEAGHAMDAIVLILEKMKEKGNMNALGEIFKDVGGDGQRLISSMVTMAKNVDMLKDHLYESQEAFEEATAVGKEYDMQQMSAIGILERANNLWEKAFVNPDGVDLVKDMASAWYDLSEMLLSSPIYRGMLTKSFQLLGLAIQGVVILMPGIINGLVAMGVWKTISFFVELKKALVAAKIAQEGFNIAAAKNVYIAAAVALSTLVTWIWSAVEAHKAEAEAQEEATRKANAWKDTLGEAAVETNNLVQKLDNYKRMMSEANISQKDKNDLVSRFNKDFRQYITNLGIEINTVDDLRKNYAKLAEEVERATYYRLREKAKEQALPGLDNDRVAASNKLMEEIKDAHVQGVGFKDVDRWVKQGVGGNKIYTYLVSMIPPALTGVVKGLKYNVDGNGRMYTMNAAGKRAYARYYNPELLSAARWYANSTRRRNAKDSEINKYYSNFIPEGYSITPTETPGKLSNLATDKDALAEYKRRLLAQQKEWRDELKQRQDDAKAVIKNVKTFYQRQENVALKKATADGKTESDQKFFIEPIKQKLYRVLKQFELAIAGKENTLDEIKKTIKDDLLEVSDETGINLSEELLHDILNENISALHDDIVTLSNNLKKPVSSAFAEILSKSVDDENAYLKLVEQQAAARRKAALNNNHVKLLNETAYNDFNDMGYANPNKEELSNNDAFKARHDNVIHMLTVARKHLNDLYKIDINSDGGPEQLMKLLFGEDKDGFGARIKKTLGASQEEWKLFYEKLTQYANDYIEVKKKDYDTLKKIADYRWSNMKRNIENQEKLRKIENDGKTFGKRDNFWSNLGLKNASADPEILLMKARMRAAQDYYEFMYANAHNTQLIREADEARQEAELNYANQLVTAMKSRLSQMKSLVQPIESFGASVGKALADMKNDAESANKAIKNALKSMLESWAQMALNDMNTQMWKAINDAAAKKAKDKAQPDIKAGRDASAKAAANGELNIPSDLGTAANPIHTIIDVFPWGNLGLEDKNGNPTGVPYAESEDHKNVKPVSTEHSPSEKMGNAPASPTTAVSPAATNVASQTGEAAASVATGQSTLGEAVAGMAGSAIGTIMNTDFGSKQSRREKREQRKQQREAKKHQRELTKEAKKGVKEREKLNKKGNKEITKSTEEESKAQVKTEELKQNTTNAIVDTALNTNFQLKKKNDQQVVEQSKNTAQAENTFSIVGAVGKCFEFLGPIAGPIAAAAVMALLTGLMQWGLNAAFGGNKNKNNSPSGKSTKIVSGMLTYDSGNVQDMKPFVADNGEIYWAEDKDSIPQSGVNLLTAPTATTINGQRSLVAENGPELVVGRETTRAMMMNNPSLLKALVNYDRNYSGRNAARKTFDEGNISEATGSLSSSTPITEDVIANSTASNVALLQAVNVLLQRLNEPISAKIDMYGRGNLYDSMTKANQFMKNKS